MSGLRPPRGWLDPFRQVAVIAVAYFGYELVAGLSSDRVEDAVGDGRHVIALERALHVYGEQSLQAAVLGDRWLVDVANWIYLNGHFVLTGAVLAWVYFRRNEHYDRLRNAYVVAMGIALVVYALLPVAPPRLFPDEGFVDTLRVYAGIDQDHGGLSALINPYAAVPSMHVAFALLTGGALATLARARPVRLAGAAYPPVIVAVVIVTGNHFVVDAAAGALVAAVSLAVALRVLPRVTPLLRERRWATR